MKKAQTLQVVNILATVLALTVNGLANALPINGQTTGEISDRFDVFFVPAGFTFAIWGVIYLALIAFAVYQALPSQRGNPIVMRIGYWYALGSVANSVWIFLWHYELFTWTLVAMFTLLISLIVIYTYAGVGRFRLPAVPTWAYQVPFSIYLGWISVATIANVSDVLAYVGWNGFGLAPEWWAVIMLYVAGVLTVLMGLRRRDAGYALVIMWAAVGIAIKQSATPIVSTNAWILAGIALLTELGSAYARARARSRASKTETAD